MALITQHSLRALIIFAILFLLNLSSCEYERQFFNNRVIVYHNDKLNFFDAYETCQSDNMQLLTIQNPIETWLLINKLKEIDNREVWLAATDLDKQGVWTWTATGKEINRIPWGDGQPANASSDQRCMCVDKEYNGWDDVECNREMPFICEDIPKKYKSPIPVQQYLINGQVRTKIAN